METIGVAHDNLTIANFRDYAGGFVAIRADAKVLEQVDWLASGHVKQAIGNGDALAVRAQAPVLFFVREEHVFAVQVRDRKSELLLVVFFS